MFSIPPLHLLLGLVNTTYNALTFKFPEASAWPNRLGLVREAQHGGIFNGNSSRKLLIKCALLLDCCSGRSQMAVVKPFYEVFKSLDLVVESCFGYVLQKNYLEKIPTFETQCKEATFL